MNDTIIFLVLAGLALIFRWLTSRGDHETDDSEPAPPNEQRRRLPAESEEERVRRFLEALGVPPGSSPPPPVERRARRVVTPAQPKVSQPKRRRFVQPLPPLVTTPPDMPPTPLTRAPVPEPVVLVEERAPEIIVPPPLPRQVARPRAIPPTSLGAMLRSRSSIRRAIILREVLGPPRGLEPIGSFSSP